MWNVRVLAFAGVVIAALGGALLLGPCDSTPQSSEVADDKPKKKKKKPRKIKRRKIAAGADELACPECNVIVISVDTLRADHLGTYGYERPTSPNIDDLAKDSLVFEQAISQSAWTVPSHASMFTGQLPREHGLILSSVPGKLSKDTITLAEQLVEQGYRTASFGGGNFVRTKYRLSQGFDEATSESRSIKGNFAAAQEWLYDNGHRPFFLFVHGFDLLRPYRHSKYNTFKEKPAEFELKGYCREEGQTLKPEELEYVIAQYDGGVVYADRQLGKFFQFLAKHRLFENSIVIVTSGNGEAFFEHGQCDHAHGVYRELTRVPLIIRLPSKAKARVPAQVAAGISLMPTVLGMIGVAPAADANPALDLRAVLRGTAEQTYVISETGRGRRHAVGEKRPKITDYQAALRTAEWTLVYTHRRDQKEKFELFANAESPAEKTDVSRKQAKLLKELKPVLFPPDGKPVLPAIDPETPAAGAAGAPAGAVPAVKVQATTEQPEQP